MSYLKKAKDIPFDVLPVIVAHLHDRNDLYNITLVNKAFYQATVPSLYEELDSRLISSSKGLIVHHPAETLLRNPKLAVYVRSVKESGTLHGAPQTRAQNIHVLALCALRICTSLRSFSWVDDNFLPDETFLAILDVLKLLPLRELTICTFKNLGDAVWDVLNQFKGLKRVSIFCMEGPPRILQGWSKLLGPTLTHLELGRCSGVPPTLLLSVFSHLQSLTHLRIKGAHSPSLPYFIASLPRLRFLDTDYTDSGSSRGFSAQLRMPALEMLTLRGGSVDAGGPVGLWNCARVLLSDKPNTLREFRLQTFATSGETSVPRPFILFMAKMHGGTLERFLVGTTMLLLDDIACVCDMFPRLEELSCAIPRSNADPKRLLDITEHAYNLRALHLLVHLFTPSFRIPLSRSLNDAADKFLSAARPADAQRNNNAKNLASAFLDGQLSADGGSSSVTVARDMMLRPQSCLRHMTIGPFSFKGEWVYDPNSATRVRFNVTQENVEQSRRDT